MLLSRSVTPKVRAVVTTVAMAIAIPLAGCSSTASSSSNTPQGTINSEPRQEESTRVVVIQREKSHVTRTGEVYLMRGLLNIFSRGMDTLAGRMRARGFDAVSYNHGDWRRYADDIITRDKLGRVSHPIIIMGHSLGGNAAPQMANYLAARGIKTRLVVAFDPTEPQVVGKGVKDVVNYYLQNGRNTLDRTRGFSGKLQSITVSHIPGIEHTNVEKNTRLQNQSIDHSMRVTRKLRKSEIAKIRKNSRSG